MEHGRREWRDEFGHLWKDNKRSSFDACFSCLPTNKSKEILFPSSPPPFNLSGWCYYHLFFVKYIFSLFVLLLLLLLLLLLPNMSTHPAAEAAAPDRWMPAPIQIDTNRHWGIKRPLSGTRPLGMIRICKPTAILCRIPVSISKPERERERKRKRKREREKERETA